MGTVVAIEVLSEGADAAVDRAFAWFRQVEACCSRFNPDSELRRLSAVSGAPVEVSPLLLELLQFALAVAEDTGGVFDPAIGGEMEARGFTREYSSGARRPAGGSADASYRDIRLDPASRTVTLSRPLVLDLGAVAKGLAVDIAARELQAFGDFAIDAGGDLYLSGRNAAGEPWSVGIRHPRLHDRMIETIHVSGAGVCTSGDYERYDEDGARAPHILDPRTRQPAGRAASATVIAPTAVLADALATTAFVLGPDEGIALLERAGVQGVIYSASMARRATAGFPGSIAREGVSA